MQNRLAPMVEMGAANNNPRTAMHFMWIKPAANAMTTQDKLQAIQEECEKVRPGVNPITAEELLWVFSHRYDYGAVVTTVDLIALGWNPRKNLEDQSPEVIHKIYMMIFYDFSMYWESDSEDK